MSATNTTSAASGNETSKASKHNSTNHSRPYTFESRRGPHYYPHRAFSPPPATTASTTPTTTATPTSTANGVQSSPASRSTTSSTRTRSPPLHPDEIFQPPSLGEKSKHMYNSAAPAADIAHLPNAYANPYMYNYNPAVEQQPFGWNDEGGLVDYSQPEFMDLVEHRQRMILSRSRLVLRVIATICAITIVAGLSSALATYFDTKDLGLSWDGSPIWNPNIDEKPSTILIAAGGALAVISFTMLSLSAWQKIRHVSLLSNIVNIIISLVNISLSIFGAAFFVYYKGTTDKPTFWHWVCDHGVGDQQVQFGMLCGEATFSYAMAYVVAVLEILVVVNIVIGWVMLGKNGGRIRGVGRAVVVQVKKAEKKQGQWKASY
ncbi:hypothetical protein L211DRAFT_846910 [Terfezia boudieri ATCC MYA-4762]|uniref:MARVEL domain-containing protein n=1 Tax=Terfezia boudieri ATCC MYA-4762 TaxID=1051890 RepID=A0A3N4LV11_9PEZI|nr:hypothetical protein L211DRAFT_846910 [Terfezia boudieri ATCC MYA-4762]